MASIKIDLAVPEPFIAPAEIYCGSHVDPSLPTPPVLLRIATGGAGQSGLVRALANAFVDYNVKESDCEHFSVSWLLSDTSESFNFLASRAADLSITYHKAAEEIAIAQGIADRREYAWRDHWLFVGPTSNPAGISADSSSRTIHELFIQLFTACVSNPAVRFLSRYDKSAANIKESSIWTAIGQTPWAHPFSSWYHRYVGFPFAALNAASALGEYTITDRGTWLSIGGDVMENMTVFKASTDDEDDPLLNPAHILVGTRGTNRDMANRFADWMIMKEGGQKVVRDFAVNGNILYSVAPERL
ncbi:extracellular tungstate binding protein [Rutstroemia sp. NJR-2017a BBW]|nr:extracellular tungstate binding protein [Rutstroemia sp. NJR-2017a BBW]